MTKELIKKRVNLTAKDQNRTYNHLHEIVIQALHVCMARDVIKDYRYKRATKVKAYNAINTFSHVSLENYAILQLWKLFDKKNSVFNVWSVVDNMPHPNLKKWLDIEIKKIDKYIDCLSAWRNNFIGHRSEISHFAPEEFEKKYKDIRDSEAKIKSFY